MDSMVHYTSWKNWQEIQRTGFLLPKSNPDIQRRNLSERVAGILQAPVYLVGIPSHLHEGWVSSGLMQDLMHHTHCEIALQVPLLSREGVFLREHYHVSPKRFEEDGLDFYVPADMGDPRVQEAYDRYMESTISLSDYDGSYRVPEIWLPQVTPVGLIERVIDYPDLELFREQQRAQRRVPANEVNKVRESASPRTKVRGLTEALS